MASLGANDLMNPTLVDADSNGHQARDDLRIASLPGERSPIDRVGAERAAADLLVALGADLEQPFNLTTLPNDEGYDELVVVREIPFQSLCMHHMLPFYGVACRLPARPVHRRALQLARVVELFSRDLQLQERLTTQIAGWLQEQLEPKGVGVVLEVDHLCMSLRGVQNQVAKTVTSALHGLVRDDPRTREEFLTPTHGRA
jgi:GTP cyclohydrolase IA